jgi:general secretion pathway protein G
MHSNQRNHRRLRRSVRRGFSLIEVIVAVTIVAIFAAIIAPNLLGRISSANQDKALIEATKIADQVTIYLSENRGSSLGGDFDLEVLVPKYIDSVDSLTDPWGTRYQIAVPGIGREFDVYSFGPDKAPGGEGDNADIYHGRDPKKNRGG